MPQFELSPGVSMFYRDDDFTDAWRPSETIVLLHGNAENGSIWNGWMPHFCRKFRVVRPDWRGFGRSTPMPVDYVWSLDELIEDLVRLLDALGIERFHFVATRAGGTIALGFAARHPGRVLSLTAIGSPATASETSVGHDPGIPGRLKRDGILAWARETMAQRVGPGCSTEMFEGMVELMGATPFSTEISWLEYVARMDVTPELPKIRCPSLVIATDGSRGGPEASGWYRKIPGCEFVVLPANTRHPVVTHPDMSARATLDFIERIGVKA